MPFSGETRPIEDLESGPVPWGRWREQGSIRPVLQSEGLMRMLRKLFPNPIRDEVTAPREEVALIESLRNQALVELV
jgi:hypothetical protein